MSDVNVVEDAVTYYVFVKNGYRHFGPQYLSAGMTTVQYIFPIPESNAIGTLDKHCNGIVSVKFDDYGVEPECQVIAQNFSKEVYGTDFIYRFCPNFSDDMIAYSKTWDAIIVHIKTGEAYHTECTLSVDDLMLGIRFLNPQKNLFVIVKSIDENDDWWEDYLHIVNLKGQQLVDTGWNIHIGETHYISPYPPLYYRWFIHDHDLFVYDHGKMVCTDGDQPVSHPFAETFNINADRIGNIKDLAIHPTLPFGVMIEDHVSGGISHQLTLVCWEAKKQKHQIVAFGDVFEPLAPLFGLKRIAFAYPSFSPDGDWYVVGCISQEAAAAPANPKDPFFIAIPVDHERPDFLAVDDLVVLGQVKNMTSLAWTTDPVSFVVSNGELLHKWDLTELPNARIFAMPEDSEKKKTLFWKAKK